MLTQNQVCSQDNYLCEVDHDVNHDLFSEEINSITNDNQEGIEHYSTYLTPNGTKHWVPNVANDILPVIGMEFSSFKDVQQMYESYAERCGFETRLATMIKYKGAVTHRYILCSKAGRPRNDSIDTLDVTSPQDIVRNSNHKATNCRACIKVKVVKGTKRFMIYSFVEEHNHSLIGVENMDFSKKRRQLLFSDQELIYRYQISSIGPVKAHRIESTMKGGQHLVRGTKNDWKNFGRDIRCYIGDKDAQMLVDRMKNQLTNLNNFTFKYKTDNGVLNSLFWADDISKCNYQNFGDVLAFDATYSTNKYGMIFVPFTGVDHHKKCVTFGAGLIHNEKFESYKWLLEAFLEAHVKQPTLVLSDQDPAMKQAIAVVLTDSVHRLCMWHITNKLPSKLTGDKKDNSSIRSAIHKLVWNVFISPETFERRWQCLIDDFYLHEQTWLKDMFEIRDQWVPAYFRDLPMCCLMKTTSRCESSNATFKTNSTDSNTLVQFMMCFESAMDAQRYQQRVSEYETATTSPTFRTILQIERHAASLYTRTIFKEVQKEIFKGVWFCYQHSVETDTDEVVHIIRHNDKRKDFVTEFKVTVDRTQNSISCSCNGFGRIGYLCRHIFCVYKNNNVEVIPDQYIKKIWRIDVLPSRVFNIENRYGVVTDEKTKLRHEAYSIFDSIADRLRCDVERLPLFVEELRLLKSKYFAETPSNPTFNAKRAVIQDLLNVEPPEEINIHPPEGIHNKGSGRKKGRIVGPGEKARMKKNKYPRKCHTCGEVTNEHDSRNCPTKKKNADESPAETETSEANE